MAACNFSIPFMGQAEEVIRKAESAISTQGGDFSGDSSGGKFNVSVFGNSIRGAFTVAANQIHVTIDSKPFLVPCSSIESFLRSKLV